MTKFELFKVVMHSDERWLHDQLGCLRINENSKTLFSPMLSNFHYFLHYHGLYWYCTHIASMFTAKKSQGSDSRIIDFSPLKWKITTLIRYYELSLSIMPIAWACPNLVSISLITCVFRKLRKNISTFCQWQL